MRAPAPFLTALAATALLLTACGAEHPSPSAPPSPSASPVDDPGKEGVRVTSLTVPAPSPTPSPRPGHRVHADPLVLPTDSGISAAYEVVNDGPETLTYTAVIAFVDAGGGAVTDRTVTVRDVGPGSTVRGTVRAGELPPTAPRVTDAEVLRVTEVPAAEAPATAGPCPASGVRISSDEGDAAMGLRVVGLHLDNCGPRAYAVDGYPLLELLDAGHDPVEGVTVLHGTDEITTGLGGPPRPVTLAPGESATATLAWRNTTGSGTAVNAPYVRVRAKEGATPVTVTPHLDLGTTGRLGVTPWEKAD
ncbi:DUF4232 domain-containing protein [Streptomyces griseoviridis]|uniref:DUF4232 domain-containing protein n=3 Tax=Streptomyces TaxID=1883 RepID=A0A918GDA7_STRGD|nr:MULTISPECIES: DUF4232 domain-containing protein [Streptomyces]MDP9682456.1 hypothetical protein [Streptomyces griseoviridis]GGS29283.1 hypothetical protein GCM10010238_17640 [Streptomyces niveoruber]GGS81311.1 hypothetical protein GCM10010240_13280 [Streptomyces griseoviridis]GGU19223.1 hypothetical protein GCM10010259_06980 [Streptomyces daghestanicus]GHI29666.1 hypothetical protein Sdagh_13960 [Streptomyces daghestanicus]